MLNIAITLKQRIKLLELLWNCQKQKVVYRILKAMSSFEVIINLFSYGS